MVRRPTINITGIRGASTIVATSVWRVVECPHVGCRSLQKLGEDSPSFGKQHAVCASCKGIIPLELVQRVSRYKYCRVCEWLLPIGETLSSGGKARGKTRGSAFDYHKPNSRTFRSERQLECRECKKEINRILNPKRTTDQHREAAQKRKLNNLLSGAGEKIDSRRVFQKFGGNCFRCGKRLILKSGRRREYNLDHTLPARYFWPLTTDTATLLCGQCNNKKHDAWPSEVYSREELQRLSVLTGILFPTLAGPPVLNPDAVKVLVCNVDQFLRDWIRYPGEIRRIRKIVLEMAKVDIKDKASHWPAFLDTP